MRILIPAALALLLVAAPAVDAQRDTGKRLGMALGHFADIVERNEKDGYLTVGLLATCPSMPGLVAGLQRSGPTNEPIRIGMLWLDAHGDINSPETTRSGSLGGMPVASTTRGSNISAWTLSGRCRRGCLPNWTG